MTKWSENNITVTNSQFHNLIPLTRSLLDEDKDWSWHLDEILALSEEWYKALLWELNKSSSKCHYCHKAGNLQYLDKQLWQESSRRWTELCNLETQRSELLVTVMMLFSWSFGHTLLTGLRTAGWRRCGQSLCIWKNRISVSGLKWLLVHCDHILLRWLGVILYWLYLFVVSIILLNLLIAQFANTYGEELKRARISTLLERAVVLHRIESAMWAWGLYLMAWHCCKRKIAQLVRHQSYLILLQSWRLLLQNLRVYFYRKSSQFKLKQGIIDTTTCYMHSCNNLCFSCIDTTSDKSKSDENIFSAGKSTNFIT